MKKPVRSVFVEGDRFIHHVLWQHHWDSRNAPFTMPTGLAARRATRFRPSPRSGYATFPLVFPLKVDQVTSRIPLQFQADVRRYRTTLDGAPEGVIYRIHEGGEVLESIEHDKTIFSVTLGGPDGKTLFMLATEFHGAASVKEMADARVGEVVISKVSVPGAGWP